MTAEAGEQVATETTPEVVEVQDTGADASSEIEARARELGWVPEAEWKGDRKPAKFLPADEFIERGETIIPLLKSQLARQQEKFDKRLDQIEKQNDRTRKAVEAQHAKEVTQLRNAARFAASKGDLAAFDDYSKQLDDKIADGPQQAVAEDPAVAKQKTQDAWIKANSWYTSDEEMAAYAFGISNKIAEKTPDLDFEENLRQTTERVKAKFPEKFGGSKPAGHAAVDGGGFLGGAPLKSDPLSKLPAEARAQAKRDMTAYPKIYPNADAWIKAFNS